MAVSVPVSPHVVSPKDEFAALEEEAFAGEAFEATASGATASEEVVLEHLSSSPSAALESSKRQPAASGSPLA